MVTVQGPQRRLDSGVGNGDTAIKSIQHPQLRCDTTASKTCGAVTPGRRQPETYQWCRGRRLRHQWSQQSRCGDGGYAMVVGVVAAATTSKREQQWCRIIRLVIAVLAMVGYQFQLMIQQCQRKSRYIQLCSGTAVTTTAATSKRIEKLRRPQMGVATARRAQRRQWHQRYIRYQCQSRRCTNGHCSMIRCQQ